jgi:hypothetical protein
MIDFESLASQILDNAVAALGEGAALVSQRAKHRAPVRNIFSGNDYHFRSKSIAEVQSDRAAGFVGSALTWRHEDMAPIKTASGLRSSLRRDWRQRRMLEAEFLLNNYKDEMAARKAGRRSGREPEPTRLTRRGAHEVKVALASSFAQNPRSARYAQWGQSYVGGRLRGEIYATFAEAIDHFSAMLPPESRKQLETQRKLYALYAQWFKHIDARIVLAPEGIELDETVALRHAQ